MALTGMHLHELLPWRVRSGRCMVFLAFSLSCTGAHPECRQLHPAWVCCACACCVHLPQLPGRQSPRGVPCLQDGSAAGLLAPRGHHRGAQRVEASVLQRPACMPPRYQHKLRWYDGVWVSGYESVLQRLPVQHHHGTHMYVRHIHVQYVPGGDVPVGMVGQGGVEPCGEHL